MADPKPLSDAERTQLETLQARDAAARQAEIEAQRKADAEAFKPAADFVAAIDAAKIEEKLDVAITSVNDVDVLNRLMRIRSILQVDLARLRARRDELTPPPAPEPTPPPPVTE